MMSNYRTTMICLCFMIGLSAPAARQALSSGDEDLKCEEACCKIHGSPQCVKGCHRITEDCKTDACFEKWQQCMNRCFSIFENCLMKNCNYTQKRIDDGKVGAGEPCDWLRNDRR